MKLLLLLFASLISMAASATDYKCVKGNCHDGWGRRTYGDSEYYEGNFSNGQFEGKGTFENNEKKYSGGWKDGWYDGEGTLIRKQTGAGRGFPADLSTGTFAMGKLNGQGAQVSYSVSYGQRPDTLIIWKGTFKDGELRGSGSMRIAHSTTYYSDSWTGNFTFDKGYEIRGDGQRNDGSMTQTGLFINANDASAAAANTSTNNAPASSATTAPASGGSMLDYGIFNTHQKKLDRSYAPENAPQYSGNNSQAQTQKADKWSTCSCCGGKGYTETYVQGNSYQIKDHYGNNAGTTSFQRTTCSCCHGTGK